MFLYNNYPSHFPYRHIHIHIYIFYVYTQYIYYICIFAYTVRCVCIYMFTIRLHHTIVLCFFLQICSEVQGFIVTVLGPCGQGTFGHVPEKRWSWETIRDNQVPWYVFGIDPIFRIPQTNSVSLPLKMDGWKAGFGLFSGASCGVFKEGTPPEN